MFPVHASSLPAASAEQLAADLAAALQAGWQDARLALAWQPAWQLRGGACAWRRAGVDWTHPRFGPLGPQVVAEAARHGGVAARLDDELLQRVVAALARTGSVDGAAPAAQVPVSAQTLTQPWLAERLRARCQAAGLAPARVQIVLPPDAAAAHLGAVQALAQAGFGLVLEQALEQPLALGEWLGWPLVGLGVPMGWIQAQAADGGAGLARVQAFVRVAHALGAQAIATGVDAPQDLPVLRRLRVDMAWGLAAAEEAARGAGPGATGPVRRPDAFTI